MTLNFCFARIVMKKLVHCVLEKVNCKNRSYVLDGQ
jgi:hypothetical protein